MGSPRFSRRTALRIGFAGLVASTGVGIARSELRLSRRTLKLPNWHGKPLRVAQVTDVHLNNSGEFKVAREAVEWAVAEKPDLFVFTGDFMNNANAETLGYMRPTFAPLEDLTCPLLACLGNHDYTNGNIPRVLEEAAKTPLRLLKNEIFTFDGIDVVGLDDALHGHPDYALVDQATSTRKVVLLHEPDAVVRVPDSAAIVLSGHSHGGEICFPGRHPIYTPKGAKRYKTGYYPHARVPLYVNRGTGTLGPARVYCPPEVAILTLTSA